MKIKLNTSIASATWSHAAGEIVDFDAQTAKRLIESGQAEAVEEKKGKKNAKK